MATQESQQRVKSRYGPANELLAELRRTFAAAAEGIAVIGDAAYEAERDAEGNLFAADDARHDAEEATATLVEWRTLLEDYRRGLVDREELLGKTVGRG